MSSITATLIDIGLSIVAIGSLFFGGAWIAVAVLALSSGFALTLNLLMKLLAKK